MLTRKFVKSQHVSRLLTTTVQRGGVAAKFFVRSEEAPTAMAYLGTLRPEIERELAAPGLVWDPHPDKKQRTIRVDREFNISDQSSWPVAIDWLCVTACKWHAALAPRIEGMALRNFRPSAYKEMRYQWTAPYLVDDSKFRAAFKAAPTPFAQQITMTSAWALARGQAH